METQLSFDSALKNAIKKAYDLISQVNEETGEDCSLVLALHDGLYLQEYTLTKILNQYCLEISTNFSNIKHQVFKLRTDRIKSIFCNWFLGKVRWAKSIYDANEPNQIELSKVVTAHDNFAFLSGEKQVQEECNWSQPLSLSQRQDTQDYERFIILFEYLKTKLASTCKTYGEKLLVWILLETNRAKLEFFVKTNGDDIAVEIERYGHIYRPGFRYSLDIQRQRLAVIQKYRSRKLYELLLYL